MGSVLSIWCVAKKSLVKLACAASRNGVSEGSPARLSLAGALPLPSADTEAFGVRRILRRQGGAARSSADRRRRSAAFRPHMFFFLFFFGCVPGIRPVSAAQRCHWDEPALHAVCSAAALLLHIPHFYIR